MTMTLNQQSYYVSNKLAHTLQNAVIPKKRRLPEAPAAPQTKV